MKPPLAALPYSEHTPDIIAALRRISEPNAIVDKAVRRLLADLGWIVRACCCELTPAGRRVLAEHTTTGEAT